MTDRAAAFDELRRLLHVMQEGNINAAQVARLEALLLEDAELRRYYLRYSNLCGGLRWANGGGQVAPPVVQLPSSSDGDIKTRSTPKPVAARSTAPLTPSAGLRLTLGIGIAACAAILVAFMMGRNQDAVVEQAAPAASNAVAVINSIRLQSGTATFAIDKVGSVVLEGPADFDLLSPSRARLGGRGRMRMRVTEQTGRGFVVETPSGEVTDLGTEFGLDLSDEKETGLVVFEGMVDLRVADASSSKFVRPQRLVEGDGVLFRQGGQCDRIMSITTGMGATFERQYADLKINGRSPLIISVRDNLHDSKKFYEVVPGGMREDARCYGDRAHEWNGATADGMPAYLIGADYVKTFNEDHVVLDQHIQVTLSRPVRLFVFLDARLEAPEWLQKDFHNTGDRLGQDAAPNGMKQFRNRTIAVGPSNSIDEQFTIWERDVPEPGVITLGSNVDPSDIETDRGMYGIAAVALDAGDVSPSRKE